MEKKYLDIDIPISKLNALSLYYFLIQVQEDLCKDKELVFRMQNNDIKHCKNIFNEKFMPALINKYLQLVEKKETINGH